MTILKFPCLIALAASTALMAGCGSTPGGTASLAPTSIAPAGAAGMVTADATTASAEFSDQRPEALGGPGSSRGGKPAETTAPASGNGKRSDGRTSDGASDDASDDTSDDTSDDASDDTDVPPEAPATQAAPPSMPPRAVAAMRVEIEGVVSGTDPVLTTLTVNGLTVAVLPTAVIRHGNQAIPFMLIQVGDRVHIKATRPDVIGDPLVAREVKVQRQARVDSDQDTDGPDDDPDDDGDDEPVSTPAPTP